jgi:sodium transport system permease protein
VDVATRSEAGGSVWAKLFPFLLVMMSLTGAFYPAIDLCAGEKERGTMETLLISPASRTEIVLGKFFTVMLASMATAALNLASMGLTAMQLGSQLQMPEATGGRAAALSHLMTAPSWISTLWMLLILVPLSAFFSAICLTLAVLARSMKEGQYYMTPLYLVALPLIFATLAPGIELSPLTSLMPITGVCLLLKALLVGEYGQARRYFLPVLVPLLVYGGLALRWAVDQFKTESVLFREAERFDLRSWLKHLWRDREPTPGPDLSVLCFVLILLSTFFTMGWFGTSYWSLALAQVVNVLGVPVVMALLLTRDRLSTLRLKPSALRFLALGAGLALSLNPLTSELRVWVEYLFPVPNAVKQVMQQFLGDIPDLATALLLLAGIVPVCEEVAFRGFILSGLQKGHRAFSAIVLSAFLFGFMHVLLSVTQQLVNATLLGLVLGLLAVRSGSLLPGILFHMVNNGLVVALGTAASGPEAGRWAGRLYRDPAAGLYHEWLVVLGAIVSAGLLAVLVRSRGTSRGGRPRSRGPTWCDVPRSS